MVKIYIMDLKNKVMAFYVNISDIGKLTQKKIASIGMTAIHSREETVCLMVYNVFNYWVDQCVKAFSSAKGC